MPLLDHFNPPVTDDQPWDALHGAWPTVIVMDLNRRLPAAYVASPQIRLGSTFEIDVATRRKSHPKFSEEDSGGVATAVWAPPKPTLSIEADLPEQDEYEVRIVETDGRRLVAAVEIVSPANKDRPEHRRAFIAKCAALLQKGVCVSIIDLVTNRRSNLYGELLDLIGQTDPSLPVLPSLYAVTCRYRENFGSQHSWQLQTWAYGLALGEPLPKIPLWLSADLAVPLDLEATYEQTCKALRIP